MHPERSIGNCYPRLRGGWSGPKLKQTNKHWPIKNDHNCFSSFFLQIIITAGGSVFCIKSTKKPTFLGMVHNPTLREASWQCTSLFGITVNSLDILEFLLYFRIARKEIINWGWPATIIVKWTSSCTLMHLKMISMTEMLILKLLAQMRSLTVTRRSSSSTAVGWAAVWLPPPGLWSLVWSEGVRYRGCTHHFKLTPEWKDMSLVLGPSGTLCLLSGGLQAGDFSPGLSGVMNDHRAEMNACKFSCKEFRLYQKWNI